jgi:hypothetical protein
MAGMIRKARRATRGLLVVAALARAGAAVAIEQTIDGQIDLRLFATDSTHVWLEEGLDKARFGSKDEPARLGVALLDYGVRWSPLLSSRVVVAAFDDVDKPIDATEAYLELTPVPRSAWRWRGKLGAFYPPISLENIEAGWTSLYTLSYSAIDTWVGEEIRIIGGETSVTHMGQFTGSANDFGVTGGVVRNNDPLGALLAWRGWALHDRQTGLRQELPFADLPAFGPTGSFPPQAAYEKPFTELDGRLGYYAAAHWSRLDRVRVRLLHYDNRGNAHVVRDGQWAWRTRFDHLGVQLRAGGFDLLAQAIDGETEMDGFTRPLVLAPFRAAYLLASRELGRHRVSVRYDRFEVDDHDRTVNDPNQESGHAWTAAWFVSPGRLGSKLSGWRLGLEYLRVASDRPARRLLDEPARRTEQTWQLALQKSF